MNQFFRVILVASSMTAGVIAALLIIHLSARSKQTHAHIPQAIKITNSEVEVDDSDPLNTETEVSNLLPFHSLPFPALPIQDASVVSEQPATRRHDELQGPQRLEEDQVDQVSLNLIRLDRDGSVSCEIRNHDLRSVLEQFAFQSEMNVLLTPSVSGRVTASLHRVEIMAAMDAVLRATRFNWHEHRNCVYVGTDQEIEQLGLGTSSPSEPSDVAPVALFEPVTPIARSKTSQMAPPRIAFPLVTRDRGERSTLKSDLDQATGQPSGSSGLYHHFSDSGSR